MKNQWLDDIELQNLVSFLFFLFQANAFRNICDRISNKNAISKEGE